MHKVVDTVQTDYPFGYHIRPNILAVCFFGQFVIIALFIYKPGVTAPFAQIRGNNLINIIFIKEIGFTLGRFPFPLFQIKKVIAWFKGSVVDIKEKRVLPHIQITIEMISDFFWAIYLLYGFPVFGEG